MATRSETWLVVLGANGEILAADRGAPSSWRGRRIGDAEAVPDSLKEAARAATEAWRRGPLEMFESTAEVPELGATVKLVVLPAVGARRIGADVRKLVAYCMTALGRQARALDIELTVDVADDVPAELWLDPEKTAWALTALAGNSLRHVKHGTRMMPGGSIALTAAFDAARSELVLTVSDDGPGMSGDVLARLFERVPGAPHATGLGLVVVRDLVNAQGGSMTVKSSTDPGEHGTSVMLRLPTRR